MSRKLLHLKPNIGNRLRDDKGRYISSPKTILIDESGDLGNKHEKSRRYFIVAAIVTDEPDEIGEISKKYPKNTRIVYSKAKDEIKFNTSDSTIRLAILKEIKSKNPKVFTIITDKHKTTDDWPRSGPPLYFKSVEYLLDDVLKHTNRRVSIIFDEHTAFKKKDVKAVCEKAAKVNNKELTFYESISSSTDGRLHAADFVTSAIGYHFNSKKETKDRKHYFKVIISCTKIIKK